MGSEGRLVIRGIKNWRNDPEWLVLAIGLAVHAVILFVALPLLATSLGSHYGVGFADDYDDIAWNLVSGNGYRFSPDTAETLMREPGYPFLLALVFSIFGHSLPAARGLNLLLMAATASGLIAVTRLSPNARLVGAAATALFLLHPGMLIAEARGGFEVLYALCLVFFVWGLNRALSTQRMSDYFWTGVILGSGVLVRSSLIGLPLLILISLLLRPGGARNWRPTFVRVATLSVGMLLVAVPWIIRNYNVVHEVVPTATISGIAAHVGEYVCRNSDTGRTLHELDEDARNERAAIAGAEGYRFKDEYFPHFFSSHDEVEFSKLLLKNTFDYYVSHPGVFLKCMGSNLVNFWIAGRNPLASTLNAIVQVPYLLLAVIAIVWLSRTAYRDVQLLPIMVIVVYTMILHAVTFAQARYSTPLVPLLAILAAHPAARAWSYVTTKR